MLSNQLYDPGEPLGDVVLAAEQRIGGNGGRIVLFGDTSMMSNGLLRGCYDFDARMLAYVSNRTKNPQALWRQAIAIALVLAILGLIALQPHPIRIAACSLVLAAGFSICTEISHRNATIVPGQVHDPKTSKLVYIDTSHEDAPSLESWRDDGTMGLGLCWEREGYLTMNLNELTRDRLERAHVLISDAPGKPFSDEERQIVKDWVNKGGVFICAAGYDRSEGSRAMLADFGLYVGSRPGERAPEPLGWFKSPYLELPNYKPAVRFWAAWPVEWNDTARIIAAGGENKPVLVVKNVGEGKVVLAGDTDFLMNRNLENEDGQPIEGMHENSDFWHWFIEDLRGDEHPWTPSAPSTQPTASVQGEVTP